MTASPWQPGLPPAATLKSYRIWDAYFTPSHSHPGDDGSSRLMAEVERALPAMRAGQFERACYFPHVGIGTTTDAAVERRLQDDPEIVLAPLERWPDFLMAMIQVNARDVQGSRSAVDRWLVDPRVIGIYLPGGGPGSRPCNDPELRPLIETVSQRGGIIMVHTWFKTGGKTGPGESTPAELAELAASFPDQTFVCAHAGGEWERGIRAIRESPNVMIETSGFDATAGFIEMAVREIGARRILFGSHLPSRSLGTELGKIIGADIREQDRRLILGENFRRLLRE